MFGMLDLTCNGDIYEQPSAYYDFGGRYRISFGGLVTFRGTYEELDNIFTNAIKELQEAKNLHLEREGKQGS